MWTFNKFFSHFIFWKLLIRVLSAYIFFLLKNGKKTCSKITIFETLFANNNIHMSIISDCCFKTAMAYKRLRWLFCWPLIHCTCPVDKIKKKHLPELIQKYFWSWCIPYLCNIHSNLQIKYILSSLGYLLWAEIFLSVVQPDIWALYYSSLDKQENE